MVNTDYCQKLSSFLLFLFFKKKKISIRLLFALLPLSKNVRPFAADLRKLSRSLHKHPHKDHSTCVSTSQSRPTAYQATDQFRIIWMSRNSLKVPVMLVQSITSRYTKGPAEGLGGGRLHWQESTRFMSKLCELGIVVARRRPRPAHRLSGQGHSAQSTRAARKQKKGFPVTENAE